MSGFHFEKQYWFPFYHWVLVKPWVFCSINGSLSPNYSCFNQPSLSGRGGGVAIIFNSNYKCYPVSLNGFSSFESLCFLLNGQHPVLCVLIYRPPKANTGFIQEFSELLSFIMASYDRVLILGDFNIHVCCPSVSSFTADFINLFESFNLVQSVNNPTHNKGHTLDLALSFGVSPNNMELLDFNVSDHKAVIFHTLLPPLAHRPSTCIHSRSFNYNAKSF